MRILIPHKEVGYFYGGAEKHIKEVAKRFAERGHKITILTEKDNEDPLKELKKLQNIEVIYLKSDKISKSYKIRNYKTIVAKSIRKSRYITKFLRILANLPWMIKSGKWIRKNKKKFDVVWVSKYIDTLLLQSMNKFTKISYVISLEGYDFIEAENAKKSKFIFTISEFIRDKCKAIHGFEPELITIGIDRKKFQKVNKENLKKIRKKYCKKNGFLILNVARLVESKDIPTFIKAASKVSEIFKNVYFVVCGEGEEKENLKNLIKKLNLEKKFFILPIFGDDLIEYYKASDIFVHVPKEGNHFGVVYIEAMAAGLPIIAANKDASPQTVGNAALLVKPEDPLDLSNSIIRLIKNKKLRDKLSKNSKIRVRSHFDWDKIIFKMEDLFNNAANS